MEHTPTFHDLDILASDIAQDGATPHAARLKTVAAVAEQARLYPGSAAILVDPNAAPVLVSRALLTVRRHWCQIVTSAAEWNRFSSSFGALTEQWNAHQELRASGDIAALAQSRAQLDALRVEATLHPTQP